MFSNSSLSDILNSDRLPEKSIREAPIRFRDLSHCLDLEVQSAGSPLSKKVHLELVDMYARLGCSKTSNQLLRRLTQSKDSEEDVFKRMLERAVNSGDLKLISNLYAVCKSLPNPGSALSKILAKASEKLGQPHIAGEHWANLIREGTLGEEDWREIARFLSKNSNCQPLTEALLPLAKAKGIFRHHSPALQFCLVTSMLQSNRNQARSFLDCVPIDCLDDTDVSLEFAIVSFRLGAYDLALKAIEPLKGARSPIWLENIIRLFNGAPIHDDHPRTVRIDSSVNEAVLKSSAESQPHQFIHGRIHATSNESEGLMVSIIQIGKTDKTSRETLPVAATFSALTEGLHIPDPWEILLETDSSVPHLMVQRTHRESRLHAFAPSGKRSTRFAWEPARLEVTNLMSDKGRIVEVCASSSSRSRENSIWAQVLQEISQFDMEEMNSENER